MENNGLSALREAPHLVILGAGASLAALPLGDKNKKQNFEVLYSDVISKPENINFKNRIDFSVREYFSSLELPDEVTIYDLLVCSLGKKDAIATFNWDPLLNQAVERNLQRLKGDVPKEIYLHGNVSIGYHEDPFVIGPSETHSKRSGKYFQPSNILFPVKEKNYQNDIFSKKMWKEVERYMRSAFLVTIFGYAMPASDVEARKLFSEFWGSVESRDFEEIQIIDLKEKVILEENWNILINSHHFTTVKSFKDSTLFNFPRKTVESEYDRLLMCKFLSPAPYKNIKTFEDLDRFLEKYKFVRE